MKVARWTFRRGEDWCGESAEEKENFLFLLGVRSIGVAAILLLPFSCPLKDRAKAGPSRFRVGEVSSLSACLFVRTEPALLLAFSAERGVKKRLKERGVTGGGLLGLCRVPVSETTDGGEEGIS